MSLPWHLVGNHWYPVENFTNGGLPFATPREGMEPYRKDFAKTAPGLDCPSFPTLRYGACVFQARYPSWDGLKGNEQEHQSSPIVLAKKAKNHGARIKLGVPLFTRYKKPTCSNFTPKPQRPRRPSNGCLASNLRPPLRLRRRSTEPETEPKQETGSRYPPVPTCSPSGTWKSPVPFCKSARSDTRGARKSKPVLMAHRQISVQ